MSIKNTVKRLLGDKASESLIRVKKNILRAKFGITGAAGRIAFADGRAYRLYHQENKNVFFGYYDLQQYNPAGDKLLAHVTDKNAEPAKHPASLVWIDSASGEFHEFAKTKTWCHQQGARLRWHPAEADTVLYNDLEDGKYVLKKTSILTGEAKVISRAVCDVDARFENGLSLNFSRLQKLRPGYGYSLIPDENAALTAPEKDGVFHVDMRTGEEKLLFSLAELAKDVEEPVYHYINHICICPSGERFTFFHLWTKGAKQPWKMRFYAANMDGTGLKLLEEEKIISHYCWLDDERMVATNSLGQYVIYRVTTGEKQLIESEHLNRDGHPSPIPGGIITDTYPGRKTSMQHVFRTGLDGTGYEEILQVFSDPRKYGECRCDLHPRAAADGKITIDTTAAGGVRSVLAFEL